MWKTIAAQITATTGKPFTIETRHPIGGGCINDASLIEGNGQRYFVKLNRAAHEDMFAAEAAGLRALAVAQAVRVPMPVCCGSAGDDAWLVMEYLDLRGGSGSERLGRELARMHRSTRAQFGWLRDNTIGSTPQINTPAADWISFWRDRRLGYQLELAARNGYHRGLAAPGERLMAALPAFFSGYSPAPSLLHGDLWSGNAGALADGTPVLFDPAVYYGDREADLAMTELFGGFGARFMAAYHEAWPIDPGYRVRKTLYNLYHILNHLNLFGGGYLSQAQGMMERLLGEM
jgi:fructosamine-3-kinase